MKLCLLGAPGSGKGTFAKKISQDFSIPQISLGDLLREIVKNDDKTAKKLKNIISKGELISDELANEIISKRIKKKDCKNGFILDGFPRSIDQARELDKISHIDSIILIDVEFDKVIERISSRLTCSNCGEIYNKNTLNSQKCLKCGAKLVQRDDDKPETIKHRLEVYEENITPVINFYSDRLFKISNNSANIDETYKSLKTFLEKLEENIE